MSCSRSLRCSAAMLKEVLGQCLVDGRGLFEAALVKMRWKLLVGLIFFGKRTELRTALTLTGSGTYLNCTCVRYFHCTKLSSTRLLSALHMTTPR